jgi:hypothetical protein
MNKLILDNTEHRLLSMHVDDIEPLFVLYNEIRKSIPRITISLVSKALIKLVNMGFLECFWVTKEKWLKCKSITLNDIEERIKSLTDEENEQYQSIIIDDYYFKITKQGKLEEAKEIYNSYYPQA